MTLLIMETKACETTNTCH